MSSLRAFRIQKSRPITSSPSSVGDGDAPSSDPNSQETQSQNGANGNSNHLDDSSEDIIRPLVRDLTYFFLI